MRIRIMSMGAGVLALMLAAPVALAAGGGSMGGGSFTPPRQMTPEEQAKAAYNRGVRAVKKAGKHEKAAATAKDEKKKTRALDRTRKEYATAREYFSGAVQLTPKMHEAWNYIGYTSRKLGEYDVSLAAYDEALRLNPAYAQAIEYRGETYLALNRVEDAKGAYMALFRDARPLADQLMTAMQQWVAERRADAAGLSGTDVDAFAQWIDERASIAQQTASLSIDGAHTRWN